MEKTILQSILEDRAVIDEITALTRMPASALGLDRLGVSVEAVRTAASRLSEGPRLRPEGAFGGEAAPMADVIRGLPQAEAIVVLMGRPPLFVQDNRIALPELDEWHARLLPHRALLERRLPSIGRIELRNHYLFDWVGTGWLIADDIIVTNRHVAEIFAAGHGTDLAVRKNAFGEPVLARIDFREEYQREDVAEVDVSQLLWIEPVGGPDLAFLRVKCVPSLPAPLPVSDIVPDRGQGYIAVVGYPARDPGRNDPVAMHRIFEGIYDKKRFSPGEVIAIESPDVFTHDCTTLGGNSGSAVLDVATGTVVGLHFAGEFLVRNKAVPCRVLLDRIAQFSASVAVPSREDIADAGADLGTAGDLAEKKKKKKGGTAGSGGGGPADASTYANRQGYDRGFISGIPKIEPPVLNSEQKAATAEVDGGGLELKYTHFSVWMNADRRLAWYTAVNIDGSRLIRFARREDAWIIDPRIDVGHQVGNHLYQSNRLDRGHLVRRLDPVWGADAEARQAMEDTFHYTNAAPQHERLNQVTWLELENHLLDNADVHDFRLVVFSGPVFRGDDHRYRGIRLPREFWKVVVMAREAEDGALTPHATAYVLSQADLLTDIEFVFGAFKTYQVPLREIESRTGLGLAHLRPFDPLERGTGEAVAGPVPISDWRDIVLERPSS